MPEAVPFREENIKLVSAGQVKVNLPWLKLKKEVWDPNCHPVTGSSDHYAIYDTFHEGNTKDRMDALRKINLVPELAGWVNSQCVEHFVCGNEEPFFKYDDPFLPCVFDVKHFAAI